MSVPTPRERLRQAFRDLHPSSVWRGPVMAALRAVDEPGPERIRALYWLHDALAAQLPRDRTGDTVEHRAVRRALEAIEDELVADHARELRAA